MRRSDGGGGIYGESWRRDCWLFNKKLDIRISGEYLYIPGK